MVIMVYMAEVVTGRNVLVDIIIGIGLYVMIC